MREAVAMLILLSLAGCAATTSEPDGTNVSGLPPSPVSDAMVRCLGDAGWEVTRSIYGGVDGPRNLAPAQSTAFQTAYGGCGQTTGWTTGLADFSESQREELYVQELAEQQCLSDLGYPSDEPPSKQSYLDTFASADQCYAILVLNNLSQGPYEAAITACPPPTWFLNITGFDQ